MGECPELGGEDDGTTIQYYVDGVAVNDDESGKDKDGEGSTFPTMGALGRTANPIGDTVGQVLTLRRY